MVRSASRSGFLLEHDLFGKPVSTRRVKPEGMLFRIVPSSRKQGFRTLFVERWPELQISGMKRPCSAVGYRCARRSTRATCSSQ
jgi:hypothetical protein